MAADRDRYENWYSERLWGLMPAVYRAADSVVFEERGPLRELIDRIGAQMAIVRRSIDQLWDDQSIETCDDWTVPYLADLVAATLFSGLDSRGQRLQVAKAIYYRRRAGTVAVLEEAAHDVTGWEARVVEFFHNLARTRHQFDMPIGLRPYLADADLDPQTAERLVGPLTRTPAGGWADLRNAYGASRAHGAFDDMAHSGEMRRGVDRAGWYNIPRLGIFVWRLHSFPEVGTADTLLANPVADPAMPNCFTFDPTGREVPLFSGASRGGDSYGSRWITPQEWQLPGPIDRLLFDAEADRHLYGHTPASVGVYRQDATQLVPLTVTNPSPPPARLPNLLLRPERGRFWSRDATNLRVLYHYGSAGRIGAGAYDRRLVTRVAAEAPAPETRVQGGGTLPSLPATATLTVTDSLTYTAATNIGPVKDVTIRAEPGARPLLRTAPPSEWRITGATAVTGAPEAVLRLEGMFLSGPDLVLDGEFAEVSVTFSTLDPGSAAGDPASVNPFRPAIDGRPLRSTHIWIEGRVNTLRIASSITGPIRTRANGQLEHLVIDRSIVQAVSTVRFDGMLTPGELFDLAGFVKRLRDPHDALATKLASSLAPATQTMLANEAAQPMPSPALQAALFFDLNAQLPSIALTTPRFSSAWRTAGTARALANERLIVQWFPVAFDDAAIALAAGDVTITRSTILGPATVHRIDVSESILHDVVTTEDPQHGCVRFSSWASGSVLPRKYESVEIAPRAEIFTSTDFGQPGYGQLLHGAAAVREGAENGSEQGAFYDEINAIRERSLLLKLQELMPLGLIPVIVPVT